MVQVMHGNPENLRSVHTPVQSTAGSIVIDMHKLVGAEQMPQIPVRTSHPSPLALKVGLAGFMVTATTLAICVHLY